jgi:hypothetical protein
MANLHQKFPKLSKYMTINHDINYIDPTKLPESRKRVETRRTDVRRTEVSEMSDKFIDVIEQPNDVKFTNSSWYENGTSNFIYYPYNYPFGVQNGKWRDNYGGFIN